MNQGLWLWESDTQSMPYATHEVVRFRVMEEEWHDQTPDKPIEHGAEANNVLRDPPLRIKGSMRESGLGLCLWWDD